MRTTREHTYTETVLDKIFCDLCGTSTVNGKWPEPPEGSRFSVAETWVQFNHGRRWPDDEDIQALRFDLCPKCFLERLVPWLQSQGAKPTTERAGPHGPTC